MLHAIGVGPGDPELLTLRAHRLLEQADLVAGFATVLQVINGIGTASRIVLTYQNQTDKLTDLAALHRQGGRCAVVFMGDPSFSGSQLLARVEQACKEPVESIPGISSAQLAAARAGVAFEDLVFVTFHKRGDINNDKNFLVQSLWLGRGAIILPRPWDFMPKDIATMLIEAGVKAERKITVYESLSVAERAWEGTLGTLSAEFSDLSLMVIRP